MSEAVNTLYRIAKRIDERARERAATMWRSTMTHRLQVLDEAAASWGRHIEGMQEEVQRHPEIFPVRVPSTEMPSPDGWRNDIAEVEVPYWNVDTKEVERHPAEMPSTTGGAVYPVDLTYTPGAGWAVALPGASLVREIGSFTELASAIDDLIADFEAGTY